MWSGLSWDFPLSQTSDLVRDNMNLIMPLLVLILGVLVALLLLDGITSSLLKIAAFVVNSRSSHHPTETNLNLGVETAEDDGSESD